MYVYIDGFSFYYGISKPTNLKWCDLLHLSESLLPNYEILKIKLFTGRSKSIPDNPKAPDRQNQYLKALRTFEKVEVIDSKYSKFAKNLVLEKDQNKSNPKKVKVVYFQEKKSDVNLAVHMVMDAVNSKYDVAAIFTNDTDFVEPIKRVRYDLNKKVILVPTTVDGYRMVSKDLLKFANSKRDISLSILTNNQLPKTIKQKNKSPIIMPDEWNQ